MKKLLIFTFAGEERQRWLDDKEVESTFAELSENKLVSQIDIYEMEAVKSYTRPEPEAQPKDVKAAAPEATATAVPVTE